MKKSPRLDQLFDSIENYVDVMLEGSKQVAEELGEDLGTRQVNSRIDVAAYRMLGELADELMKSRSTLAAELLELAIAKAWRQMKQAQSDTSP